jgi:hypothetical protein
MSVPTKIFLVLLYIQANAETIPKIRDATACNPPDLNYPFAVETTIILTFQIIVSTHINEKAKLQLSLSQAYASYHPNIFTFTLPLLERRAGESWEPSDRLVPFLQPKVSLAYPHDFLVSPFCLLSFLSLSSSFKI